MDNSNLFNNSFLNLTELDSSSLISHEDYYNILIKDLEQILQQRFIGNKAKQQIKKFKDRITISCPICGDSVKDHYKKRGNIILRGEYAGSYKCFNCGAFKSITQFLKDCKINPSLDLVNYLSSIHKDLSISSHGNYDLSTLMDETLIEKYAFEREELKTKFNFIEVKQAPQILIWLRKRLQYDEERFLYHPSNNYLVILNLTKNKKILGFQQRNFSKFQDKYKTFNLRKIYEILKINVDIPEEVNVLSQLYKICEIDFNKPVILFEGALDSFVYPFNSIANSGANKNFPIDFPIWYFYDNDKTGVQKAISKLNLGHYVFLWTKFSRDLNLPYREKWDFNDVKIWIQEQGIKLPYFEKYFSNNTIDLIDI